MCRDGRRLRHEPGHGASCSEGSLARGVGRASNHSSDRRAGDEDDAGGEAEGTEQEGAGLSHGTTEHRLEGVSYGSTALGAEHREEPDGEEREAGAERLHLDERGSGDHQAPHPEQRKRKEVPGCPDDSIECFVDLASDDPAVPAEGDDGRQEEPEAEEAEPDQLRMCLPLAPAPPALLRPDARRALGSRLRGALALGGHAGWVRGGPHRSCLRDLVTLSCGSRYRLRTTRALSLSRIDCGRRRGVAPALGEASEPLDQQLHEAVRVDSDGDVGVLRPVGAAPKVDDRPPATELRLELDLDVPPGGLEELGPHDLCHCDRIMDRRSREVVDLLVEAPVELEQLRDDLADPSRRAELLCLRPGRQGPDE